jgi:hypothetical protein
MNTYLEKCCAHPPVQSIWSPEFGDLLNRFHK